MAPGRLNAFGPTFAHLPLLVARLLKLFEKCFMISCDACYSYVGWALGFFIM